MTALRDRRTPPRHPKAPGRAVAAEPPPVREGGVLVSQVHQLAGRVFARVLRRHGIEEMNPAQGRIVYALWKQDGLPQGELALRTRLDKSTLALMLDRLERGGQVVRERDPLDGRRRIVRLTARNRALHGAYLLASHEMLELFYRGIPDTAIEAFEETLRRVAANLAEAEATER